MVKFFIVLWLMVGVISIIKVYYLEEEIKSYRKGNDNCAEKDKTFVIITYKDKINSNNNFELKKETVKLDVNESYEFKINSGYELLGFHITRK